MTWKQMLHHLHERFPDKIALQQPLNMKDFHEFNNLFHRTLDSVDPGWKDVLMLSNGLQILSYVLYPFAGESIQTISFKSIFIWEMNKVWEGRLYVFMGGDDLLEFAIQIDYLGVPAVTVLKGYEGYESAEPIPLSSNFDIFFNEFLQQVKQVFESEVRSPNWLSSLHTWPPQLDIWYARDTALTDRLLKAGLNKIKSTNKTFGEYIFAAAKKAAQ
jgi:hypothetical protein